MVQKGCVLLSSREHMMLKQAHQDGGLRYMVASPGNYAGDLSDMKLLACGTFGVPEEVGIGLVISRGLRRVWWGSVIHHMGPLCYIGNILLNVCV